MKTARFRPPYALLGTGLLVVALGFGLPRLTPDFFETGRAPASESAVGSEKAKGFKLEPASDAFVAPQAESAPDPVALMGRMILMAAVAGGSCVAVVKFMVRKPTPTVGAMEVIASIRIDAKSMVYLVRAGERRLLLGADQFGVKDMVELPGTAPEPEEVGRPLGEEAGESAAKNAEPTVVGPLRSAVPTREQIVEFLARRFAPEKRANLFPRSETGG